MSQPSGKRRAELLVPAAMIALAAGALLHDRGRPAPVRFVAPPPPEFWGLTAVAAADGVSFDESYPMTSPEVREYDRLAHDFVACFRGDPNGVLWTLSLDVRMARSLGPATTSKAILTDVPPAFEAIRHKRGQAGSRPSFEAFFDAYLQLRAEGTGHGPAIGKALERVWTR